MQLMIAGERCANAITARMRTRKHLGHSPGEIVEL